MNPWAATEAVDEASHRKFSRDPATSGSTHAIRDGRHDPEPRTSSFRKRRKVFVRGAISALAAKSALYDQTSGSIGAAR
jgi:hypothetical protein